MKSVQENEVLNFVEIQKLFDLRCDWCKKLLAKEQRLEEEELILEIKCPRCGKVSRFVLYQIG